jgi:CheY-like chemotaxis protein
MANILVVDDDDLTRTTLRLGVREAGHEVRVAGSGEDACDLMLAFEPDVLLIDLQLPGMDGYQVLTWMRRRGIEIPTVAMTGYPDLFEPADATALGASLYLRKPLFLEDVIGAVARLTCRAVACDAAPRPPIACSVESLHVRLAAGDVTARDPLLSLVWPKLMRQLRRLPGASRETAVDATVDALMDYLRVPGAFDPSRGVPLDRFLAMAARRNFVNYSKSEYSRKSREQLYARESAAIVNPDAGGDRMSEDLRQQFRAAKVTEAERALLMYWLDGDTASLMTAIDNLDATPATPHEKVKRFKDRMRKRFARLKNLHG